MRNFKEINEISKMENGIFVSIFLQQYKNKILRKKEDFINTRFKNQELDGRLGLLNIQSKTHGFF
jgi:hypothetical protein